MNWQPGQEYKMRDGGKARVYAVEAVGGWPIHGAYFHEGVWRSTAWRTDGKWYETLDSDNDLMPPPPVKHVRWVAFLHSGRALAFLNEESAGRFIYDNSDEVIACLRIEFKEGEGL